MIADEGGAEGGFVGMVPDRGTGDGAAALADVFLVTTFLVAAGLGALLVCLAGVFLEDPSEEGSFLTVAFFVTAGLPATFLVTIVFWSSAIVTHSPRWLEINIPSSRADMEIAETA